MNNNKSKLLEYSNQNISLTEAEKEKMILDASIAYGKFLDELKINWRNDPNSSDTPQRVVKSFVNDLISGCYNNPPIIKTFPNDGQYDGMVFSGKIDIKSICAHHHLPFYGYAYVAYIPDKDGTVIGLSKLNRIVEWFARRPQIQENLTMQIHEYLTNMLEYNQGVAVMIRANHMCTCLRGVKHDSYMITSKISGAFGEDEAARNEFYQFVNCDK